MGQKVNPIGMRLQVNRTWDSRWFADSKDYGNLLLEDLKMRAFVHKECVQAGVSRVIIERPHRKCRVTIHTARPGVIIGKKGADIETLRKKLANFTKSELHLNIVEVRKPELDAQLVAESITQQLERRDQQRLATASFARHDGQAIGHGQFGAFDQSEITDVQCVQHGMLRGAACRRAWCLATDSAPRSRER